MVLQRTIGFWPFRSRCSWDLSYFEHILCCHNTKWFCIWTITTWAWALEFVEKCKCPPLRVFIYVLTHSSLYHLYAHFTMSHCTKSPIHWGKKNSHPRTATKYPGLLIFSPQTTSAKPSTYILTEGRKKQQKNQQKKNWALLLSLIKSWYYFLSSNKRFIRKSIYSNIRKN